MLRAVSHLVLASHDVPRITDFFARAFGISPHFANDRFAEFVLPSAFRIAFFKPVEKHDRDDDHGCRQKDQRVGGAHRVDTARDEAAAAARLRLGCLLLLTGLASVALVARLPVRGG